MFAFQNTNDSINAENPLFQNELYLSFSEKDYCLDFEDNDISLISDINPFDLDKQKTSQNTYLLKKTKSPNDLESIIPNRNIFTVKNDENENFEKIKLKEKPVDKEEKNKNVNNILEKNINSYENLQKLNLNELSDKNTINKGTIQIEIEEEKEKKAPQVPQYGRKTDKEKKSGNKGKHTKKDKDNQMRKIKAFFGKSLYKYLKNSFIEETDLLKLEIDINKNLKRDFNLNLFERTLKDIYSKSNISFKYKLKNVETNEELINKIFREKKEKEVMKILELTYGEAFEIFRQKLTLKPPEDPECITKILELKPVNKLVSSSINGKIYI